MANFSNYYRDKIIDHMLRGQAFSPAATVYIALFSADTGLQTNAPSAELSAGGYVRKAVALGAPSAGVSSNPSDVEWDAASASWGTITHAAIVDHPTNTTWGTNVNVLMWNALEETKAIGAGDIFKFATGNIVATVE